MDEEVQQLRELVLQLKAENGHLLQEQAAAPAAFRGPTSSSSTSAGHAVPERLIVVPRDCKRPMFNGRTGIGVTEWVEEVHACC